jgi:hypothetical protein
MPPSVTNYGSAPDAIYYVSPQSGYATSATNTQHLYSQQPSQRARIQHHAAHVPIQNQYWYQENAQAQLQSSQNLNPDQYQRQSQHESPHQVQWAAKPEQIQQSPIDASAQRTPVTSWRRKLICSAVECEFKDVQLKEPPFPFYQRWDEDAENLIGRGKKRSRSQYEYEEGNNDEEEEEEESYDYDQNGDNDYDEEHTTNSGGFCCGSHMVHSLKPNTLCLYGEPGYNHEAAEYDEPNDYVRRNRGRQEGDTTYLHNEYDDGAAAD